MARRALKITSIALPLAAAMSSAPAQSPYQPRHIPGTPPLLQRVDPTIADVSPLGESLREVNMQVDLRPPTGFQHVYRVPGNEHLLMRVSGGMYAIFPQSAYLPTESGMAAIVPAGTIFSIGSPGPWNLPSRWVNPPALRMLNGADEPSDAAVPATKRIPWAGSAPVDDRHAARLGGHAQTGEWTAEGAPSLGAGLTAKPATNSNTERATPPDPSTFLKTIVTDDAYRISRLGELLKAAAESFGRSNK